MTKPKPLDLKWIKEEIKKIEEDEKYAKEESDRLLKKKMGEDIGYDESLAYLKQIILEELYSEIIQRLKFACGFYLRYKDKPELLKKEQKIEFKLKSEIWAKGRVFNFVRNGKKYIDYNEWLFKLAFKPMALQTRFQTDICFQKQHLRRVKMAEKYEDTFVMDDLLLSPIEPQDFVKVKMSLKFKKRSD